MDIEALRRGAETPVEAGKADLPGVAADLTAAFTDDIMFNWMLRDDSRRAEALARFFRAIADVAYGAARIERPATGGAAAVWLPFEAVGPLPLMTELKLFPTLLFATGLSRFSRLVALRAAIDSHHPMEKPHAYLWFLGVAPQAQGMGVGSRLLKVGTDRLDAAGLPAYLETQKERNVGLYQRHGFEVISTYKPRADAPPMWSMWREPKTPEA
jgi:ribosomal protein S18 acetylase RimI-like enzyme